MNKSQNISKIFLNQIGNNIKERRKKRGLTLESLGLEIGLTRMQVHRIESGYNITLTTFLKISIALNVKPELLLKSELKFKQDDLEKLLNESKSNKKNGMVKRVK